MRFSSMAWEGRAVGPPRAGESVQISFSRCLSHGVVARRHRTYLEPTDTRRCVRPTRDRCLAVARGLLSLPDSGRLCSHDEAWPYSRDPAEAWEAQFAE